MADYHIRFGNPTIFPESKDLINRCLESGFVTAGLFCDEFEERFSALMGYPHCCFVDTGSNADLCALLALYELGAKPGDEIIVPANSFIATSEAVFLAGFKPVWVDVEPFTLNMDHHPVERAITSRTRAVMCVSNIGRPCKMDVLRDICDRRKLTLICDNCEGHFAEFHGKKMGQWADITTYSFYAAHVLFSGKGGAVCCRDAELDETCRSIRSHGRPTGSLEFNHLRMGWNMTNTDLHASIGLGSLNHGLDIFKKRKANLRYLMSELEHHSKFYVNGEAEDEIVSPHALNVTLVEDNVSEFVMFRAYLEEHGIQTKLTFRCIPTQQPSFAFMGHQLGEFPNAEKLGRTSLHLGCHEGLTPEDLSYIVETIRGFWR